MVNFFTQQFQWHYRHWELLRCFLINSRNSSHQEFPVDCLLPYWWFWRGHEMSGRRLRIPRQSYRRFISFIILLRLRGIARRSENTCADGWTPSICEAACHSGGIDTQWSRRSAFGCWKTKTTYPKTTELHRTPRHTPIWKLLAECTNLRKAFWRSRRTQRQATAEESICKLCSWLNTLFSAT